jgi:glycine oxidase
LIGATREEGRFDQEITADGVAEMLAAAAAIFPDLKDATFVEARAGVRPGSPDGVPILGPVPGWESFSVASGHDQVGIMLSPASGELMADYISTGDPAPLEPFSLARFRA